MVKSIVAWLLYHANQEPGHFKGEFYRIKNGLLQLFGTSDGKDLQVLPKKQCYSCNRTGTYSPLNGDNEECWNCYGTGVFKSEILIPLKRYRIGRQAYVFHQPIGESYTECNLPPMHWVLPKQRIVGIIKKKRTPYSTEARLWLYLLFSFTTFRREFRLHISFASMDKGIIVGLHRFYRHCEAEIKRRKTHLDISQSPNTAYALKDYYPYTENLPF